MKKHERMYQQIEKHGNDLKRIFNLDVDAVKLAKKLHSLEVKAHQLATDYCNGENGVTTENWEEKCEPILKAVRKVLNCTDNYPIFLNGDVRGYALKIKSEYVEKTNMQIYKDWGGYGIIAPEFDGN
jgi:hypothetical protein